MLLGTMPKSVGRRSLTLAEEQALQDASLLDDAQIADLESAGWTFAQYVRADQVEPESPASDDGPLLAAVKSDLAHIDTNGGARKSLAALALWLAEVMDRRGSDGGATTAARLGQELRATMVALTTKDNAGDPDMVRQLLERLSTPSEPAAS